MSTPKNNNNDEIAPDLPEMRSVLIRSSGPSTMMPASRTGLYEAKQAPVLKSAPPPVLVTKTKSAASGPSTWNPDPLPKLPEMYPLERSHAKVKDVSCIEIATRIADCLQKESIAATFEENKAVAETSCHTQFYVKLFEDESHVIVEVQRSRGCSFTFSQCSKAILCAAKGVQRRPRKTFQVPSFIKAAKLPPPTDEALDMAFDLVAQSRVDAQRLGLESLMQLTRQGKVATTLSADRLHVLCGLVTHADHCREAVTILANLLEHDSIEAAAALTSDLVQTLMVQLVEDDLHLAHQAAKCLNYYCKALPDMKKVISQMGVAEAQQHGLERHAQLAEQTQRLQKELSS